MYGQGSPPHHWIEGPCEELRVAVRVWAGKEFPDTRQNEEDRAHQSGRHC